MNRALIGLAAIGLLHCGPAEVTEGDPSAGDYAKASTASDIWEEQGTTLLGTSEAYPEPLHRVLRSAINGGQAIDLRVVGGRLQGYRGAQVLVDSALRGTELTVELDGGIARLIVGDVQPAFTPKGAKISGAYEYRLTWSDGRPFCEVTPSLSRNSTGNWAVPVAGAWSANGAYDPAAPRFVFACRAGVVRKCLDWGFGPADPSQHQACTRMARADYCGDGVPHTVPGTQILPLLGPADPPSNPLLGPADPLTAQASFEAAWAPDGASCVSTTRWAALSMGPRCARLRECPSGDTTTLKGLVDYSVRTDIPLFRWVDRTTGASATVPGDHGISQSPPGPTLQPPPPSTSPPFEGSALSPTLFPDSRVRQGMKMLTIYRSAQGGSYTTTGAAPAGGLQPKPVGYIYATRQAAAPFYRSSLAPLYTFRHTVRGDYLTTVVPEGQAPTPPAGYGAGILEGYVVYVP